MPMVKDFIPRRLQPWLYLLCAVVFQMTSCLYMGSLSHLVGSTGLMREDLLFVNACAVVGVNMPFPFLFRMKFRFTNRRLLIVATSVMIACNFFAMHTTSLPLLCVLAYLAGFFKLCGTFEIMSNIQLWMTPKRDFRIFFPLLYIIVLGDISMSGWVAAHLTYYFGSWQMMNWFIIGAQLLVLLFVFTCTRSFRFMKPMPFVSLDYLGCALWSALLLEGIFIFNYGEYYNWSDSHIWRMVAFVFLPVTLIVCVGRMLHIRHPYIAPEAWKYKTIIPMLGIFFVLDLINSTNNALFNVFTSGVLHYGYLTSSTFNLVGFFGTVIGCMICYVWFNVLKQNSFNRLFIIGFMMLLMYVVVMYFNISPTINIEKLYLPVLLRTTGYAMFFVSLTVYLTQFMPFQHFFMGLTMMGFIRNGLADSICTGTFSFLMRHHVAENLQRWAWEGPLDMAQPLMVSIKQLYGATCMFGVIVLLAFMLWDMPMIKSSFRRIPYWNKVGQEMKKEEKRG